MIYLPQDRVIPVNEAVDPPGDLVLPSQVVEHFVEQASYHWIMNWCLCRDASKCRDYPIELGCLFLGEAAMQIDPRLGRRATKEEALDHVRRCREAGLVHLIGRNKLDPLWLGVGPGDKLLTICNCCPCCCLWRVLPYLSPQIGDQIEPHAGGDGGGERPVCGLRHLHAGGVLRGRHPVDQRPVGHQRRVPGLRPVCEHLPGAGHRADHRP